MNINCRAIVHLTSLAVPFLELSKGNKSIVIMTSNNTDKPLFGEMIFSVSKVTFTQNKFLHVGLVNDEHVY